MYLEHYQGSCVSVSVSCTWNLWTMHLESFIMEPSCHEPLEPYWRACVSASASCTWSLCSMHQESFYHGAFISCTPGALLEPMYLRISVSS